MADAPGPARPSGDAVTIEERLGPELVARMLAALRNARLYDATNQTLANQIGELHGTILQLLEDELSMISLGQSIYLNGHLVRAPRTAATTFEALSREFESRDLGGFRVHEGVRVQELVVFIKLLASHSDARRAAALPAAMGGAGVTHVSLITTEEVRAFGAAGEAATEAADERERAKRTYAQAVQGVRGAILRSAKTGRPAIRPLKRVVQPIVESIMNNEYSIVGLTALKQHDEYTYAHCVNVSVVAIGIGSQLGMSRAAVANLGVAAILHDIGKLRVSPEVLAKPGKLTDEEWQAIQRHPLEGVLLTSQVPGFSPLNLEMLQVCLQHHLTCDGGGYPRGANSFALVTGSRIVAVADCFDALTSHRTYRTRPMTGYEALQLLLGPDRSRYDTAVVWALVKTVGLYPAGTLLLTTQGHLVVSLGNHPEDVRRPVVRLIARPDGTLPSEHAPEIWSPLPQDLHVARVLHPEEFGFEIDRLMAA